jgi:hypothetical protein
MLISSSSCPHPFRIPSLTNSIYLMKPWWWMHLHKYANIEKHLTAAENNKKYSFYTLHIFLQCHSKCKQNGWRCCYCLSAFRWWWWFERLFISHKFLHSRLFKLEYENSCVIERKTKNLCSIEMYKCNSLKKWCCFCCCCWSSSSLFLLYNSEDGKNIFLKKILNKRSARENCIINSHAICNNAGGECLILFENKWI